jgi:hypothetical protein
MKTWELLSIVSSSLVVVLFSGPWIALRRSFKTLHPKLFLGIVNHMSERMTPAMTVLAPISVLSMIAMAMDSYRANTFAFRLTALGLLLNFLSLIVVLAFEIPLVIEVSGWKSSSIPKDWESRRDRWVGIHKLRVFAAVASFLLVVAATLIIRH